MMYVIQGDTWILFATVYRWASERGAQKFHHRRLLEETNGRADPKRDFSREPSPTTSVVFYELRLFRLFHAAAASSTLRVVRVTCFAGIL